MTHSHSELKDEELVYAHIVEYQNNELDATLTERYRQSLKSHGSSEMLQKFNQTRGSFQVALRNHSLDEDQLHGLRVLVEDDVARADHEAADIRHLGETEFKGRFFRAFSLTFLVVLCAAIGWYFFGPKKKPAFDALETLVYEAVVMEEDPEGRLQFPSNNMTEVREYIGNYAGLGFKAPLPDNPGPGYVVDGATIIDYEVARIVTIQFSQAVDDQKLFLFMYEGLLKQLPKSDTGKVDGMVYRAYSDDRVNIVAWQASETVVGMMIGRNGAVELARFAKKVTK